MNRAESMVNGTVGMMMNQPSWGVIKARRLLANVEVSGMLVNQLEFCSSAFGKVLSYRLLGQNGREVDVWKFKGYWGRKTLDLNGVRGNRSEKLEYNVGLFGGTSFRTNEGRKPIYMTLTDHSRGFELDGMFFKHVDFQSKIHFHCPKRKVNQAILIASLIFNPPMTAEVSGG